MGKYKRITERQSWSKEGMDKAVEEVLRGAFILTTAKKYSLPQTSLRRYVDKRKNKEPFPENAGRFKNTFTEEQLLLLKNYVTDIDRRAFGLTKKDFARIVFDYAEHLKIEHRFNKEERMAGKDFVSNFLSKFNLSLRKPEATSVARLAAFNEVSVQNFFNLLTEIMKKYRYEPHQIYNVDETGCSTVPTKSPLIITPTGKRRVVKVSSAERGSNVSVVCCVSATGHYVPPLFIFKRVRMQDYLLHDAPPGSQAACNPESSFINAKIFLEWLSHFKKNVGPSADNQILLLMDNHASHITLEAVNFCRDNFITLLGFPPHTTHRMQPLDVSFFGPLKTAYSNVCNDFLTMNPGQTVAVKNVPSLFHKAYAKAATLNNAVKGFEAAGIVPLNSQIFSAEEFEPAVTTAAYATSSSEIHDADTQPIAGPSNAPDILVLPLAPPKVKKQRTKAPSLHATSSPVKEYLLERKKQKERREAKKGKKKTKVVENKTKVVEKKKCSKTYFDYSSDSSVSIHYMDEDDNSDEEVDEVCIICDDFGKNELWFNCAKCHKWAHAACTGLSNSEAKKKSWICDFCS